MNALHNLTALLFVGLFALATYLLASDEDDTGGALILLFLAFTFAYWG